MKIIQMKYFQAVCRFNNVSKAAQSLGVSQPAISSAIKELEDEFGIHLFIRNNNKLVLSEDGKYFFNHVNNLLREIEDIEIQMKDRGQRLKSITIGVPPIIGTFMFPKLVNGFLKENPDIQCSITETGSLKVLNHIERGSIDLGIITFDETIEKKFSYVELIDTEFVFAVNRSHHFANKKSIRFEDLDKEEIILYAIGSYQDRLITNKIAESNIKPHVFMHSSQLASILECLKIQNVGAFLHKEIVDMYPSLVGIPFVEPIKVKVGIVYNKVSGLLSLPTKFVNYAKAMYNKKD